MEWVLYVCRKTSAEKDSEDKMALTALKGIVRLSCNRVCMFSRATVDINVFIYWSEVKQISKEMDGAISLNVTTSTPPMEECRDGKLNFVSMTP